MTDVASSGEACALTRQQQRCGASDQVAGDASGINHAFQRSAEAVVGRLCSRCGAPGRGPRSAARRCLYCTLGASGSGNTRQRGWHCVRCAQNLQDT